MSVGGGGGKYPGEPWPPPGTPRGPYGQGGGPPPTGGGGGGSGGGRGRGPWSPRGGWRSSGQGPYGPTSIADWFKQHGVFAVIVAGLVAALGYGLYHKGDVNSYDGVFLLTFVVAVMLHEVSHGVMALWCGDTTARDAKRLTLNPIRHIDLFGSIILPIILVLSPAHTPFGWAKPVPVNLQNLRHPRNQAVLVGLVGPFTNIVLSVASGLLYHVLYVPVTVIVSPTTFAIDTSYLPLGAQILMTFGLINLILAVFNLIPIPPLDGSALIERLLPTSWLAQYYRMRMGFMLVVLVLVFVAHSPLATVFNYFQTHWLNAVGANGAHAVLCKSPGQPAISCFGP